MNCKNAWALKDIDRDIWDKELEDFVPPLIFDVHTHLWCERYCGTGNLRENFPVEVNLEELRKFSGQLYPGRKIDFLVMGMPLRGIDFEGQNAWLAGQTDRETNSLAGMMVTPRMSPDYLLSQVNRFGFKILKPYPLFAKDGNNCRIRDYLPESLIEAADGESLGIMLHLSRKNGISDPDNIRDLKQYTRKYPHVQWILAHCARAFNPASLEQAIHTLLELPNIWYDTSAVCDLYTHLLLLKYCDRKRIMFGSDNLMSGGTRGTYVAYAHAWSAYQGHAQLPHCDPNPTFVIYEQLRAQRRAVEILGLSGTEVQNIFRYNAITFLQCIKKHTACLQETSPIPA